MTFLKAETFFFFSQRLIKEKCFLPIYKGDEILLLLFFLAFPHSKNVMLFSSSKYIVYMDVCALN